MPLLECTPYINKFVKAQRFFSGCNYSLKSFKQTEGNL